MSFGLCHCTCTHGYCALCLPCVVAKHEIVLHLLSTEHCPPQFDNIAEVCMAFISCLWIHSHSSKNFETEDISIAGFCLHSISFTSLNSAVYPHRDVWQFTGVLRGYGLHWCFTCLSQWTVLGGSFESLNQTSPQGEECTLIWQLCWLMTYFLHPWIFISKTTFATKLIFCSVTCASVMK